jgi:hypothetical protein
LLKQRGVSEDVFFYGPESGWALRYLAGARPLCSLHIHDEQPIGIVSLEPTAAAGVDWRALSPAGQKARKQAHGSPALLWLDVELEGSGATDFDPSSGPSWPRWPPAIRFDRLRPLTTCFHAKLSRSLGNWKEHLPRSGFPLHEVTPWLHSAH